MAVVSEGRTLRTTAELAAASLVAQDAVAALAPVAARYAVAIPPALVALIDRADPADPIARQLVPDPRELDVRPEERADPIGDAAMSPLPGLIHRYPDRVLLKVTAICPVYCRFCFRREMVGPTLGEPISEEDIDRAIAYVDRRPAIREVILTGGDPLVLSPRRIASLTRRLDAIPHLSVLRWHSRVPVATPGRVDAAMISALAADRAAVYIAIHVNHPRELSGPVRIALSRLVAGGLSLLSQTVLLKGVNDASAVLARLFTELVTLRVRPYYLHHPDLAPGTSHFRLPIARGQELVRSLRGTISGLAQPVYVLDLPGGYGKVVIGPEQAPVAVNAGGALYRFTDWQGAPRDYLDAAACPDLA
jgi:lysine 2,3-aminomutase